MKKNKIIRTSTVPDSLEIFLKGFLNKLAENYDVLAVSSPGEKLDLIHAREGIRTIPIQMERHISLIKDIVSLWRLIILFRNEKPNIVHSMTPKAGLLSMLAAFITKVPIRIHTFTGLVFPTSTGFKRIILIFMDKIICFSATYINPEGQGVANDLMKFNITNKPLHIIANGNVRGIDLSWYTKTDEVLELSRKIRSQKSFTFCFVGRIVRDKGINELVHAFERLTFDHSNVRLILIGKYEENLDPIDKDTIDIIKGNSKIEYMGIQKDVRAFLAASDVFVLPSYREGFPNSVIEACALGLPCIVTDINGSNEIIIDGKNGELIPPHNYQALYEKMKNWIDNPAKVEFMASNARKSVENRFDQKFVWESMLNEYKRLLNLQYE